MRRVVIVITDGHRSDFVRPDLCPAIWSLAARGAWFRNHYAIYPSATRASAASLATGCPPAVHGLHGNRMAFDTGHGLVVCDSGRPEFFAEMRRALGRTLAVPTMAERVVRHVGDGRAALIASNASPGAAGFNDPDNHGILLHRAGSRGPGGSALDPDLARGIKKGAAGDQRLTELFCAGLDAFGPRLAVLWLSEPDTTMHETTLGSKAHKTAIATADACVARVAEAVAAFRARGDEVLLMAGSDHGQETVRNEIPVLDLLIREGLKAGRGSTDLALAPQGSAAHIYLGSGALEREGQVLDWLRAQPWCGEAFAGDELIPLGLRPEGGLRISFSMAKSDAPNPNGVPGWTDVLTMAAKPGKPLRFGSHGGLGRFERSPYLVVEGRGFEARREVQDATSLLDLAPTALHHLEIDASGMTGRALQGIGAG